MALNTNVDEPYKGALGLVRIVLGWIFLWAFLDKMFGLGYTTEEANSWINDGFGTGPTEGYLAYAVSGPFKWLFDSMADSTVVAWLFMVGLLAIGVALILGIGIRVAGITGALLMFLMYLSANIWAEGSHNPIFDDHIVYMILLVYFALKPETGNWVGLGAWWKNNKFVKQYPVLE